MGLTEQELRDVAVEPNHVAVDGMTVTSPRADEVIAVDKHLANKQAMKSRRFPIRYARFAPPGAVGPRSRSSS